MLTTYQINKRVTDFSKMDDAELKAVYGLTRKQANSRLHYYLKGKPATKRTDHATPTAKKVVATNKTIAPIASHEVYSATRRMDRVTRVLVVCVVVLFIAIVVRNVFF